MTSEPRTELIPPQRLIDLVGGGDFKTVGKDWTQRMIQYGGLKPSDSILDIGCGVGRIAVPLTEYLSQDTPYEGFDIVSEAIEWCQANITQRFPNFRFQVADLYNGAYYPQGTQKATEFRFPYESGRFDFILGTSLFTHMLPEEVDHYLSEISRVLKEGGQSLITFYLLNSESLSLMQVGKGTRNFRHDFGRYRAIQAEKPEAAVAYDEPFVLELYAKHGLKIVPPIHYGTWAGRPQGTSGQGISGQDFIITSKP